MSGHNDELHGFFFVLGVLIGGAIVFMLMGTFLLTPWAQARAAVEECEQFLPRNERCVISAIPENLEVSE